MRCMLLRYIFEPRPFSRVSSKRGSYYDYRYIIKRMLVLETLVWREGTRLTSPEVWIVVTSRLDAFQAEPPFLLLDQDERMRLWSQGVNHTDIAFDMIEHQSRIISMHYLWPLSNKFNPSKTSSVWRRSNLALVFSLVRIDVFYKETYPRDLVCLVTVGRQAESKIKKIP